VCRSPAAARARDACLVDATVRLLASDLLPTAHMDATHSLRLDRSLVRGIAWTGGVKWMTTLLTWGITLAIARLLTPTDYGLVGMAMVGIGFAQLTSDAGLYSTLIQHRALSEGLAARLGGLAVMVAVAVAALMLGMASLLAAFFREPAVRALVIVMSMTLVLRGIQVLRRALMAKALRFKHIAAIDGVEAVVISVSTLGFALAGLGYWALVCGLLTGVATSTVLWVALQPHPLRFPARIAELEGTLRVGANVFGGQVAWYAYSTADVVVVGRMLGSAALGAYTFAWVIASLAIERVAAQLSRVTPAIFAAVQHDHAAQRRYLYSITEGLGLVTMPVCIGISLTADLLVPVALGDAWASSIAPMRLLALYAALRCLSVPLSQMLVYTGHSRQSMRYNAIALVVLVPAFVVGAKLGGTSGVAWAWLAAFPALTVLTYLRYLRRTIALTATGYLRALWPAVSATAVMSAVVLGIRVGWSDRATDAWQLATVAVAGAAVYLAVVASQHGRRLHSVLQLLRAEPGPALVPDLVGTPSSATPAGDGDPPSPGVRGRLLLFSYHFPPDPSIGSLRWEMFAKHAAERGWGIDVVMRDDPSIAIPDRQRLAGLPPGTSRLGVPARALWIDKLENRVARVVRRFIPGQVAAESVPTASIGLPNTGRDFVRAYFSVIFHLRERRWARDAAQAARMLPSYGTYQAVIGCGPPFSACEAARLVARSLNIPLILDLRDPWSLQQRLTESTASPVMLTLRRRGERRAVTAADLVVTNTAPVGDAMRRLYPDTRIVDVPNGFDDDALPVGGTRTRFIIAYAGTIYLDRNPQSLFAALSQTVRRLGLTPDDIGIDFMGTVERTDGTTLEAHAAAEGVSAFVHVHPLRPRSEAMRFLADASLLVMLPQDSDLVIPGKVYEYMRFPAWILALAEPSSAVARLLRGTSACVLPAGAVEAQSEFIAARFLEHRAGIRGTPVATDLRFSRSTRAAAFFGALETVLRPSSPPSAISLAKRVVP